MGKHLCQSLFFNKVSGLSPATLLKKRLRHKCFPVKNTFFTEHLGVTASEFSKVSENIYCPKFLWATSSTFSRNYRTYFYYVSTYCIYFKRFVYITSSAHAFPHSLMKNTDDLKACVYYENSGFHQIVIFSPNDSPSKTMKNAFYFMQKALLVLKIFKFLYFCSSLFFCMSAIALEDKS